MKLFLIADNCRIDGRTGTFAEERYAADFERFSERIPLCSARNQMLSFQLVVRWLFQNLNYLHSGQPVESFAPELGGSGKTPHVASWELFDRHFGPYLDGSAFTGSRRGPISLNLCSPLLIWAGLPIMLNEGHCIRRALRCCATGGSILWIYGWYGKGMTIDLPLYAFLTHPMLCFMTGATGFCSFWNTLSWGRDYLRTPFVNGGQGFFYPGGEFGAGDALPSLRMKALRNQMQLADLMMTVDGLDRETPDPVRKDLEAIVNRCFGYENSSAWWAEKPDFAGTPPRYWDFDGPAFRKNHYEAQSPEIILELRRRVLERLG